MAQDVIIYRFQTIVQVGEREISQPYARNVPILSVGSALALAPVPAVTLVSGIIGVQLASSPSLATAPNTSLIVGAALATIPSALLMKRIGRRRGFMASAFLAGLATLLAAYAVSRENFLLFCTATFLIGINGAFVQQYRFAAAESVSPSNVGKALSYVMIGGIIAGFLGPEVIKRSQDWLGAGNYSGSFVIMAGFYVAVLILLLFYREVSWRQEEAGGKERPLSAIVRQPVFLVALGASAIAYGVMTFIMTATPVNMHVLHGFSLDATAWVIQSHIIAMFLPSLFTGFLITRLGVFRLMLIGLAALFACIAIGLYSQQLMHYWWALVLLGVGWNFLFVGGTALLTRSYWPKERFKTQAANDFTVFGVQALASLSAGAVLAVSGWHALNLIALPFLIALATGVVALRKHLSLPAAGTALEPGPAD